MAEPPPLILRPPVAADLPALSLLGVAAFVHKFGDLYRPEDLLPFLAETYSEAALARALADPANRFAVAERGGLLLGWCKLAQACPFPEHARGRRTMELKQLYTAPRAQGGGIGAALMDWAMAQFSALGADEVQLSVWQHNPGAQKFYRRYGFAPVAEVTFQVGGQLDEEFLFARML
ncbi:GNAT family N-acetyltransferase [Novosphingobium bradum]|uniref:GNAT family N-acetyltransferase n=1 Tax=Novosphingobium bradum TaxID=1737444 RepID=A0ABV7IQ02_9SPHN